MLSLKLAFRNITHAGLRTWLNVIVLSMAFVLIVYTQGLYDGMSQQMVRDMSRMEVGGGQFWQRDYDPFDPLSFEDAHALISTELTQLIKTKKATPILLTSAAIFPEGRIRNVLLKGIVPDQNILELPSESLNNFTEEDIIPGFIGKKMSDNSGLKPGDYVTVRWRDVNGTFDAADIKIIHIMETNVQTVDQGQIWIPYGILSKKLQVENEATILVLDKNIDLIPAGNPDWVHRDVNFLMAEIQNLIKTKKSGSRIMFSILVAMALLAIFDAQVLSLFRRRKEMGTMMAMGMTRSKIITLFTLEGSLIGLFSLIAGAVYGIPLLAWSANTGLSMPQETIDQFGMALAATIYPVYGAGIFFATSFILFLSVVIVSFLPTRKITKLKPTDALKGKMS